MRILVIGAGGREHALVWKLRGSPRVSALFCAPGNPGIGHLATNVPLKGNDPEGLLTFATKEGIDLTVVGPEQPLADGIVDLFRSRGLRIFGPEKAAAELEWSKAFAKGFMERHGIPTAAHRTFTREQLAAARDFLSSCSLPVVLKADGLAAGKGVIICAEREEALSGLHDMAESLVFGSAGATVVVEEFLEGQEASLFAVCDGTDYVLLSPAQDHKRIFDGDRGKNTGGMGAYAPAPLVTPEIMRIAEEKIIRPTLKGMAGEGRPYSGCLYVGLMITTEGPKVVEYNSRFGDPETQVILPLYPGDLAELMGAAADGSIRSLRPPSPHPGSAVCVVMASGGYPDAYRGGIPISGLEQAGALEGVTVFHAGTAAEMEGVVTAGGRVLGVTAFHPDGLRPAIDRAYAAVTAIRFDGMHFRTDIGRKGL
jgi:phosphoribosylamine--glycine ligase